MTDNLVYLVGQLSSKHAESLATPFSEDHRDKLIKNIVTAAMKILKEIEKQKEVIYTREVG